MNVLHLKMGPERARRPVDPATLPDPHLYVQADVRQLIGMIGRDHEAIAADVNLVCKTTFVDGLMVEGWCRGEEILCSQARALVWLAGIETPALVPTLIR